MQSNSLKALIIVATLFFFTSNLSGSFLPIYFGDVGLNVEIMLFTFLVVGLLPFVLFKFVKNFERIMSVGIFTTMLFFVALISAKEYPVILGLAYGLSMATFWPSFNLLQFKLSESEGRARTISLLSSIIPSLTGIVGPAVGGFIIQSFGYTQNSDYTQNLGYIILFAVSIVLYLIAFSFSTRIRFKPENYKFSIPKRRTFTIFFVSFIITGFVEVYWIAYSFLVHDISKTMLNMGLVLAVTGIFVSIITFLVNRFSDIRRARAEFAIIGAMLSAIWCFAIGFASSMEQIMVLSLLSGFANAFRISWMAFYADSFGREHYASILVMMEVGLMIGRVISLVPTYIYISQLNYVVYFILMGAISLSLIPLYIASRKEIKPKSQ